MWSGVPSRLRTGKRIYYRGLMGYSPGRQDAVVICQLKDPHLTNPPSANVTCPRIITRSQWGARQSGDLNYLIVPIPFVVIHHTVTPLCTTQAKCSARVANIQSYHMDTNNWRDIGYSFLIGGDGNVYEGCGWTREGAHTYSYNKKGVGIAFIGNFQEEPASQTMLNAAHRLILCGKAQGILRDSVHVIGARQVVSLASPGNELYAQIQNWPEWEANP